MHTCSHSFFIGNLESFMQIGIRITCPVNRINMGASPARAPLAVDLALLDSQPLSDAFASTWIYRRAATPEVRS